MSATQMQWSDRPYAPRPVKLFALGRVVSTAGALAAIETVYANNTKLHILDLLARHVSGDWGNLSDDDKALNDKAVHDGSRILSAYPLNPAQLCNGAGDNCLWIITAADRSHTVLLLPPEY